MQLPKYNNKVRIGENGITILKEIVEREFMWLFRPNHKEHDFGIDAFIDVIIDGQVTGKTIAAQVKTGDSYFSEKNDIGWVYRGEIAHLNYYLNHDIPVIIILIDEQEHKAYWCYCDQEKTEKAGENWKITIPFNSELTAVSQSQLLSFVSPIKDYASQLENFWKENELYKTAGRILFSVDRQDVEKGDFQSLIAGLNRLQVNHGLIVALNGKVDISINGYDFDERELYEIKEVVDWCNAIFDNVTGLSYFLATDEAAHFLRLLQYIRIKYTIKQDWHYDENKRKVGRVVEFDLTTSEPFMDDLYYDLNEFCEKNNLSIDVNKQVSFRIAEYIMDKKLPDYIKKSSC
jgi:hypothetical protein